MSHTIDYYFSPISPFTLLAGDQLEKEAPGHINYHPFDIARVFGATGGVPVPQRSEQRQAYRLAELKRISRERDIDIKLQPAFFPVDSRPAAKLIIAARDVGHDVGKLSFNLLSAVWQKDLNIADPVTLRAILVESSLDESLLESSFELDDQLNHETDAAIEAGVFGSPFYIVNDEPFWGQDRLEAALKTAKS